MRLVSYVLTKNDEHVLGKCLQRLSEVCDGIVVVDDGSTDSTPDIIKSFDKVIKVFRNPPNELFKPYRDLTRIMKFLKEIQPEWVMAMDSDDVIDKRFVLERDKYLSRTDVGRYHFQEITLWGSNKQYRADKPELYSRKRGKTPFLARWNPNFKYLDPYEKFPASLIRKMRQSWIIAITKRYFKEESFSNKNSKFQKTLSSIFWNPDFIDYANTFIKGNEGNEEELPFVKMHYHYENMYHAWRKHMNYALQTAIRHHRTPAEISMLVDWASSKLNEDGIILKDVDPEWGAL